MEKLNLVEKEIIKNILIRYNLPETRIIESIDSAMESLKIVKSLPTDLRFSVDVDNLMLEVIPAKDKSPEKLIFSLFEGDRSGGNFKITICKTAVTVHFFHALKCPKGRMDLMLRRGELC